MRSRDAERDEFAKDVALMRRLGVSGWTRDGESIVLGAAPHAPPVAMDAHAKAQRDLEADKRREEVLFAATSIRPQRPETGRDFSHIAPRGMTPHERDDGASKQ